MDGSAIGWLQFMSSHFCFALILISTPFANRLAAEVLDGRVVEDGSGSPVASARLRVLRAGSPDLSVDLETAADGRFHSPDLPAGGYRIEASKSSYISTTVLLRLPAASLTIRLVRCGAITGQVTDSQGRVPRGASVFPMVKQPGGTFLRPLSPTPLDDRGRYRLYNLSPGQYAAAVSFVSLATSLSSASGMLLYPNNARPEFFTISGGEEYRGVDFVLPPGPLYRISGTVELPAAGTRFSVAVVSTDQPALAVSVQATEPDGSFRVEGIPPGSYDLLATGPVSARSARGVVLGPAPLFGRTHVEVSGQDLEGISLRVAEGQSFDLCSGPQVRRTPQAPVRRTLSSRYRPLRTGEPWSSVASTSALKRSRRSNAFLPAVTISRSRSSAQTATAPAIRFWKWRQRATPRR